MSRHCEDCGIRMPLYRPRMRRDDGKLVCSGCHPDGRGKPGMPVGHHGALDADMSEWSAEELMAEIARMRKAIDDALAVRGPRSGPAFVDNNPAFGPYLEKLLAEKRRRLQERNKRASRDEEWDDEDFKAVDWLMLLRKLQADGMSFDDALAEANRQFPGGEKTALRRVLAQDPILNDREEEGSVERQCACIHGCSNKAAPYSWTCLDCRYGKCPLGHPDSRQGVDPRDASLHVTAHDGGEGEVIYHCPFCGGGNVVRRSDGSTECTFCDTYFTVQVQPKYPNMPQTINGQPVNMPGMPGAVSPPGTPAPDEQMPDATDAGQNPTNAFQPPDAPAPAFEPPDPAPPKKASKFYLTGRGALDEDSYIKHLAIRHADDQEAREEVLAQVRASRGDH